MRLIYVAIHTGRFDDMREFYERGLGLPARTTAPGWIAFDTAGASLALRRMDDPKRQGIMVRFETDDLDAKLSELHERGLEPAGEIESFELGRVAELWDEDGNLISLLEPSTPAPSGAGPALSTLILNVTDMVAAITFYRDRFGLTALVQSTWWTEFDTGATRLSLHPRVSATDELRHNTQPIVVGLAAPNLDELQQELAGRGLDFSGGPVEQRYGRFAEVEDPDGNVVLFRESGPRHAPTPEEIAAAFEDDSPHQAAMRSPTRKTAHSASRVAIKPAYKSKKTAKPPTNGDGAAKPRRKTASVRGAGPEGTRRTPRRSNDPERVKLRPAAGHLREAERRTLERKKRAVAATSRTRPVKRGAANTSRRSSKTGAKRAPRRGR